MSYKIVKDAAGVIIAFGPDTDDYVPTVEEGNVLEIVSELPELAAPVHVPPEISKAQGIVVMSQKIIGESNLWLMVKGYFDTEASEVERDLFKAITVFNRASPMLNSLKGLFGLTDADIDTLFVEGAKVVV